MQNNATVSNQKIIFLVFFISMALIAALFIVHLRQKPPSATLAAKQGILFPVAREIKPFHLITTDNQVFTQMNLLHHWTLLFFGFTHCKNICPITLAMLSRSYAILYPRYTTLQVAFVSLDPDHDSLARIKKYTHGFSPAFIGLTGKIEVLHQLQSQLGIFSTPDPSGNTGLLHTASILLINPQGRWAGLFNEGLTAEQFANAFDQSMQALSARSSR